MHISIGAHDFEKIKPQRILINVDIYVQQKISAHYSDDLENVVDYDFIRESITKRVARGHINLQETLADDILELMLTHPLIYAAKISTEKPDIYPDCDSVGVEVYGRKM